jgi:hypothetical protein
MSKPNLTVQEFLFRLATEPAFRKKYLANPDALSNEYEIKHMDMEGIKRIDAKKLERELAAIKTPELVKAGAILAGYHCNDSHTNHSKDGHTKDSHDKSCSDMMTSVLEHIVLPEALMAKKSTRTR